MADTVTPPVAARVVVIFPTIQDGTVVRWYRDEDACLDRAWMVSASRNGVLTRTFLHQIPAGVLDAAEAAFYALRANQRADLRHIATHQRRGLFAPLERIQRSTP